MKETLVMLSSFCLLASPNLTSTRRIHAAMVAAMDDAVGRVLGKVRARGQEENTLILPTRGIEERFRQFDKSGDGKHRSRNKWRKLPACDPAICRKLEAYATLKSDSYFSNDAKLTPDEFPRAGAFRQMDANSDGVVTLEEAKTYHGSARRQPANPKQ